MYLGQALQRAELFLTAQPESAAGWVAKGLVLSRACQFRIATDCFLEAVRRDGAGLREAGPSRLIDQCAEYYSTVTFYSYEQLGIPSPDGMKELVSALQKVLILADREVPLPGSAYREVVERIRAAQSDREPQDSEKAVNDNREHVQCPACRETLRGHVARCPHCTTVLNWMNCPACKQVVSTRVRQKFVGVARGGYQPVYSCIRCGRKLAGPDCFIATAAYGSAHEPNVQALRSFRDRVLVRSRLGRAFVSVYYAVSPGLAACILERPALKRVVRVLLAPLVWVARLV